MSLLLRGVFLSELQKWTLKPGFPRLLQFQKWLGFIMFDVNSRSVWLLHTRRNAKLWRVNPDGYTLLQPRKWFPKRTVCLSVVISDFECYFRASHLLVNAIDEQHSSVFTLPFILHFCLHTASGDEWRYCRFAVQHRWRQWNVDVETLGEKQLFCCEFPD